MTEKMKADTNPAPTKAAATPAVNAPISTPIIVAVTMNGRDVACNSPAITTSRRDASWL